MFLHGPAGLPLAVSDGSECGSVSTLFDSSQLDASGVLVPLNSLLTVDVNSLTSLQGEMEFLFIALSSAQRLVKIHNCSPIHSYGSLAPGCISDVKCVEL